MCRNNHKAKVTGKGLRICCAQLSQLYLQDGHAVYVPKREEDALLKALDTGTEPVMSTVLQGDKASALLRVLKLSK